ncbi:MAG: AAA family ATPase [Polyangiaceae bacterium]
MRDVRGKLRVACEKKTAPGAAKLDVNGLSTALGSNLGAWFAPPIVDGDGSPAHKRIATQIFEMNKKAPQDWPQGWPADYQRADGTRDVKPAWLVGLAVLNSKESWFAAGKPPSDKPRVVAFYSFKGGVGRTTTLACVADRIAARPQRVLAIDLDLEAPGLGSLLGAQAPIGVLDHLLSHLATGQVGDVDPEPVDAREKFWVLSAGRVEATYLEKLGRLDFLARDAHAPSSPTEQALRALIEAAAAKVNPDVVLLDCRAGLHDIGGLALHRLSHMDVLVARRGEQARAGMAIVLEAIRRMRPVEERDVRIVQTMVKPPFEASETKPLVESWRTAMYDLAIKTIYNDLTEDVPALEDQGAHFPLLIPEREEFQRVERLQQLSAAVLQDFNQLAEVVAPLGDG